MKKFFLIGFLLLFPCVRARGADNTVDKRLEAIEKRVEDLFQLLLKQRPNGGEEEAKRLQALEARVKALEAREVEVEELEDEEKVMLQEKLAMMIKEVDTWRNCCDALETQLAQRSNGNKNLEKKWAEMRVNYTLLVVKYGALSEDLAAAKYKREELRKRLDEAGRHFEHVSGTLVECLKSIRTRLVGIKKIREKEGTWAPDLQKLLDAVSEAIPREIVGPLGGQRIRGAVAGVSEKVNLVVINVGEEDGVRVGFEFTILRETSYVGKLVVEKVYPRQAACRVILDMTKDKVRVGDQVTTRIG
jgi:tetrahydromethanopterin S-methyltransferase subunit G